MSHHKASIISAACGMVPAIAVLIGNSLGCQSLLAQMPFANYQIIVPTGPDTADVRFVEGPLSADFGLPSLIASPTPGWDANAVGFDSIGPIPPPTMDENTLILTVPINDTVTHVAHNAGGDELGRLSMLGTGTQKIDLNATNAVVDEAGGTIQIQAGPNVMGYQPVTFSVLEETGIYASDVRLVEEGLVGHAAGRFLLPLDDDPNTTLQDNILTAWETGQIVGADVVGVISGHYVPEPSTSSLAVLASLMGTIVLRSRRGRRLPISTSVAECYG